jgi:hypothetical protein
MSIYGRVRYPNIRVYAAAGRTNKYEKGFRFISVKKVYRFLFFTSAFPFYDPTGIINNLQFL